MSLEAFPWRPTALRLKVDQDFCPILESYSCERGKPHRRKYFVVGAWGSRGYMARAATDIQGAEAFQESEITAEALTAYRERLAMVVVPLGRSVAAFDGESGMIRIYHGTSAGIDFHFENTTQPQWSQLLEFIEELESLLQPEESRPRNGFFWPDGMDASL